MQISMNASCTNIEGKENKHKTLVAVGKNQANFHPCDHGRRNLFGQQNLKVEGDQTN